MKVYENIVHCFFAPHFCSKYQYLLIVLASMYVLKFFLGLTIIPIMNLILVTQGISTETTTTEVIAQQQGMKMLIITALIIAPPVETIFFQLLPEVGARVLKNLSRQLIDLSIPFLIFLSTILFALQHSYAGLNSVILSAPAGLFLIIAYFRFLKGGSRWEAYYLTTLLHCLHNAVALAFFAALT